MVTAERNDGVNYDSYDRTAVDGALEISSRLNRKGSVSKCKFYYTPFKMRQNRHEKSGIYFLEG